MQLVLQPTTRPDQTPSRDTSARELCRSRQTSDGVGTRSSRHRRAGQPASQPRCRWPHKQDSPAAGRKKRAPANLPSSTWLVDGDTSALTCHIPQPNFVSSKMLCATLPPWHSSLGLTGWKRDLETDEEASRHGVRGIGRGQRATVCLSNQVYFHSTSSRFKTVCVLKRATAERNEDSQEKA